MNPLENYAILSNLENAGEDYVIRWDGVEGELMSNALSPGSHQLQILYSDNCIELYNFIVEPIEVIQANVIETSPYCSLEESASVELEILNGTAPYSYQWTDDVSQQDIAENLAPGFYEVTITDAETCQGIINFTIENRELEIEVVTQDLMCYESHTGELEINLLSGQGPYEYLLNEDTGSQMNAGLSAGTYEVVVFDSNACSATAMVIIDQPQPLLITAVIEQDSLSTPIPEGSIALSVDGGVEPYDFLWETGSEEFMISELTVGTYAMTLEDANGCSIDTFFNVTAIDTLNANLLQTLPYCDENSLAAVQVQVLNGTPPYHYDWSENIGQNTTAESLLPGNYQVTVTDSENLQGVFSILIENQQVTIDILATDALCHGEDSGEIDITILSGEPPFEYYMNDEESTPNVDNLMAGSYEVVVIDNSTCSTTQSIILEQPEPLTVFATIEPDTLITPALEGAIEISLNGGIEPYEIAWSNGSIDNVLSDLATGEYLLSVEDANGCTLDTFFIVHPIDTLEANLIQTKPYCDINSLASVEIEVLNGIPPYQYSWADGSLESNTISNLQPGNYVVTVSDAINNKGIFSFWIADDEVQFDVDIDHVLCHGDLSGSLSIGVTAGQPPFEFSIDELETTQEILNLGAGTYAIQVLSEGGCSKTIDVIVTEPEPLNLEAFIVNDSLSTSDLEGSISVNVEGGVLPYQYEWSTESTDSLISNLTFGNYSLIVEDGNACMIDTMFVIDGISRVFNLADLNIILYPNPTQGMVYLESAQGFQIDALKVYSIDGREVYTIMDVETESNIYSLDVGSFVSGIYLLVIDINGQTIHHKITLVK